MGGGWMRNIENNGQWTMDNGQWTMDNGTKKHQKKKNRLSTHIDYSSDGLGRANSGLARLCYSRMVIWSSQTLLLPRPGRLSRHHEGPFAFFSSTRYQALLPQRPPRTYPIIFFETFSYRPAPIRLSSTRPLSFIVYNMENRLGQHGQTSMEDREDNTADERRIKVHMTFIFFLIMGFRPR